MLELEGLGLDLKEKDTSASGRAKSTSTAVRQGGRIYSSKGISPSLSADSVGGAGGETGLFVTGVTLANKSRYEQGVDRTPLQKDNLSWALNKSADQGVLTEDVEIRKLTPVECERFPRRLDRAGLDGRRGRGRDLGHSTLQDAGECRNG